MTLQHHLVSIIVPTYNRAHLIGETIQSVVTQSYANWELLIIDDGSEDDTENIVKTFNDIRIIYLKIPHCGIFGKVRNEGLKIANGYYIAFLDSDDLWRDDKLALQLSLLQQYPNAFFIFNNVELFGASNSQSPPDYNDSFETDLLLPVLNEGKFIFYPSTLLFKKEVVTKINLMDEVLQYGTDTKYFLSMCSHFKGAFTNHRLVKIRKHVTNTSHTFSTDVFNDSISIVKEIYRDGRIKKNNLIRIIYRYYYKMGVVLLNQKKYKKAASSFYTCFTLNPFHWKGGVRLIQSLFFALLNDNK